AGLDVSAAQFGVDGLLDVIGAAFLDYQHRPLAQAELAQLLRHQRIGDVEDVDGDAARAVEVGKIEPRQRAQHPSGKPADHDDADVVEIAGDQFVELAL